MIESLRRTLGWGLVALGLVAVVAMEANGAAWSKHRGTGVHSLPHGVVVAGVVCAGLFAISLVVFLLVGTRVSETPEQRRKRWTTAITFLVIIALISIVRVLFRPSHTSTRRDVGSADERTTHRRLRKRRLAHERHVVADRHRRPRYGGRVHDRGRSQTGRWPGTR